MTGRWTATMPQVVAANAPTDTERQRRMSDENRALREVVTVYSQLTGLATHDSDLHSVIGVVADCLDTDVLAIAADRTPLAAAGPSGGVEGLDNILAATGFQDALRLATRTRRSVTLPAPVDDAAMIIAPIVVGDEIPAFLATVAGGAGRAGEDTALLVTEHAAIVCGVVLARKRVVASAAGHAWGDLVEGLLLSRDRTDFELRNWAGHVGIDPAATHLVMTFAPAPAGTAAGPPSRVKESVHLFIERLLKSRLTDPVVARRDGEVVAIVRMPEDGTASSPDVRSIAAGCRDAVEKRFAGWRVSAGIGGSYAGATDIARSYSEARRAVETTERMSGLGGVVTFSDLGIHRLLLRVGDVSELWAFAQEVLGSLLRHEREHGSDYLATVTEYFAVNNSPKQAAQRLHMHPNTVAYRVRRVEEITGLDIGNYRDRLMLQVALEIVNGLGEQR